MRLVVEYHLSAAVKQRGRGIEFKLCFCIGKLVAGIKALLALILNPVSQDPLIAHAGDMTAIFQAAVVFKGKMQTRRRIPATGHVKGNLQSCHPARLAVDIHQVFRLGQRCQRECGQPQPHAPQRQPAMEVPPIQSLGSCPGVSSRFK